MAGNFNWVEGSSTVKEIVKALATDLTLASNFNWSLAYPANLSSIDNKAIIKTKTSYNLEVFVKLERPVSIFNYMNITMGNKLDDSNEDLDTEISSVPARFAWYKGSYDKAVLSGVLSSIGFLLIKILLML